MDKKITNKRFNSLIFLLIFTLFLSACNSDDSNVYKEDQTSYLLGNYAIDVYDLNALVGYSDYFFIGEVVEELDVEYRGSVMVESESGDKEISFPYSNYSIRVLKNIKGELPIDKDIKITKSGGLDKDGQLVIYEDDYLLETDSIYAISALVQPDGSLLISGANSSILIEESKDSLDESELIRELEDAYANEYIYDRQRFEYKDD